mgnify:CR=1 FL=1
MTPFFQLDPKIESASAAALQQVAPRFTEIDEVTEYNQLKVLRAFMDNGISERHFGSSTGYGYGDEGRETLDKVWAQVFGAEDALVRHNFTCGTHTLAVALFGVLRPGDKMLCVSGMPYDTLHSVIGLTGENMGSLKDYGIAFDCVPLKEEHLDYEAIAKAVDDTVTMVYIQRSRGYELRASLSLEETQKVAEIAKEKNPNCIVMVDNCYCEFVNKQEPTQVGADLIAGSLIKNAGGGIARTGGYIAGRRDLIEQCAYRLTTPGQGKEIGCTLGELRNMFLGLFLAPNVVCSAVKTAIFAAALFECLGYRVNPSCHEPLTDIIQSIELGNEKGMVAFCKGVQRGAPVDSFVVPEPWDMPGYESKVIMAAGAFHLGASIELSADGPIREPYAVWLQGGLTYFTGKTGILLAAQTMLEDGVLSLEN